MPERVRITDVSPRDGLQNEPGVIPTADKVRLIELLCATGVDEIEVTSFVSPKWVPQLADAEAVLWGLVRSGHVRRGMSVLVPNEKGMQRLLEVRAAGIGIEKVAVFTAASETFCQRNINCSIDESIDRFKPVVAMAHADGVSVRGYVSCAIACPFEGPIEPHAVANVVDKLMRIGIVELDVADTIGAGTSESMRKMLNAVIPRHASHHEGDLVLHLHDTFGRAAECVAAALDLGVRSFDGSVAGLGGCPYASTPGRRAPGNISTELLVRTVTEAGYETGVDLKKLEEAARLARQIVSKARAEAGTGSCSPGDAT